MASEKLFREIEGYLEEERKKKKLHKFQREINASKIDGVGVYAFEFTGNFPEWTNWVYHYLRDTYPVPTIECARLVEQQNEYTILQRLNTPPEVLSWGTVNILDLDKQPAALMPDGRLNNKKGEWGFRIIDIGGIKFLDKNRLKIFTPNDRNGSLTIFWEGPTPQHTTNPTDDTWKGNLEIKGEKPGQLVRSATEFFKLTLVTKAEETTIYRLY